FSAISLTVKTLLSICVLAISIYFFSIFKTFLKQFRNKKQLNQTRTTKNKQNKFIAKTKEKQLKM
ncbi:hypothetical protein ACI3PF_19825, partial [Lactococcus lactis]